MAEREHLRRLSHVWAKHPLYFITACITDRRPVLANAESARLLIESWLSSREKHGWVVGRYVIMPDHVHFFARPQSEGKNLSEFMRDWKKWTTKVLHRELGVITRVWQPEFFDHVLRSAKSYSEKWEYVRENPVRAGLSPTAETWPYAGECEMLSY